MRKSDEKVLKSVSIGGVLFQIYDVISVRKIIYDEAKLF